MEKKTTRKAPTNEIERRNFPMTELRAITDDNGLRKIVGYAAVFNALSDDLGGFREKIDPGAFKKTIVADDIRALKNHNSDYVLGRNTKKTLILAEDQRGLKIEIIPPDAQWARDLMVSIDRGDIDQMSFGFRTIAHRWEGEGTDEVRTLMEVKLFDVSPVTFPAYPDTEVALRSHDEWKKSAAVPPGGNGGTDDPTVIIGLRRKKLELKTKHFGGN